MTVLIYQSPIDLTDAIKADLFKKITHHGRNRGATYDPKKKEFVIHPKDIIELQVDSRTYRLESYHFHVSSEHLINGERFPAELHYLFMEWGTDDEKNKATLKYCKENCLCNCNGQSTSSGNAQINNLLVIGRIIVDNRCGHGHKQEQELDKLQLHVPRSFYVYDGSRTSPEFAVPVRWLVDKHVIAMSLKQILTVTQTAREVQPIDGRLVMLQS